FENTPEDSPQPKARVVVPGHRETPGQLHAAAEDEFENTPEDSPQPKARVVVPGHRETPGQLHAAAEDDASFPFSTSVTQIHTPTFPPQQLYSMDTGQWPNPRQKQQRKLLLLLQSASPASLVRTSLLALNSRTPQRILLSPRHAWWSQATGRHQDSFMPLLRMERGDQITEAGCVLPILYERYPDTHSHLPSSAALQHGHRTVALTQGQKTTTEAAAAASECLSCVPCEDKLAGTQFENTPEDSPQPKARVVVPGHRETPGQLHAAAKDEFENTPEDSPQPKASVVVPGHRETPGQLHAAARMNSRTPQRILLSPRHAWWSQATGRHQDSFMPLLRM
ncbi:Protein Phosphatase 1 Regulatory Subunit 15B, partial [Manis pentadactyla]